MAGLYADVPGPRMAYDRDGSAMFQAGFPNEATALSLGQMALANDEDSNNTLYYAPGNLGSGYFGIIFPQLRDIAGVYQDLMNQGLTKPWTWQTSPDSTNGGDGTWTTRLSNYVTSANYRVIDSLVVAGVKGIRMTWNYPGSNTEATARGSFHVYGTLSSIPATGLTFWHPTLAQDVTGAYFDWGDAARTTNATRTFRIKNRSTLAANGVTISMEALTPGTPSIVSSHSFSVDGVTFASTLSIGTIAAGGTSGTLYVKRNNPANDQLGLRAARIIAVAGGGFG